MAWDWQVFCKSTMEGTAVPGCFGGADDVIENARKLQG